MRAERAKNLVYNFARTSYHFRAFIVRLNRMPRIYIVD